MVETYRETTILTRDVLVSFFFQTEEKYEYIFLGRFFLVLRTNSQVIKNWAHAAVNCTLTHEHSRDVAGEWRGKDALSARWTELLLYATVSLNAHKYVHKSWRLVLILNDHSRR